MRPSNHCEAKSFVGMHASCESFLVISFELISY